MFCMIPLNCNHQGLSLLITLLGCIDAPNLDPNPTMPTSNYDA